MKLLKHAVAAVFATGCIAHPLRKRALDDPTILQFALTLEHLENVFYKEALATFPIDAFLAAGYSEQFYYNLQYVAADEEQHVLLLTEAIAAAGYTPVAACTYNFGLTDVTSFATLSSILEGVGTAAYLGAAPFITNPEYLGVAGSILITESIHQSLVRYNIGEISAANPYGTALGANEVNTLASPFFVSCPAGNPPLPLIAFPALVSAAGPILPIGATGTFTTDATLPAAVFVTYVNGLNTISVPGAIAGQAVSAAIPGELGGQTYVVLTSVATTALADSQVIAGPAIVEVIPAPPTYDPAIL